jgi:hypothetical protein
MGLKGGDLVDGDRQDGTALHSSNAERSAAESKDLRLFFSEGAGAFRPLNSGLQQRWL